MLQMEMNMRITKNDFPLARKANNKNNLENQLISIGFLLLSQYRRVTFSLKTEAI